MRRAGGAARTACARTTTSSLPVPVALLLAATLLAGCDDAIEGYTPAASIAQDGFARDHPRNSLKPGRDVRLWGFVDHGNLYGDLGARQILQEWWSGDGPRADTWRFNLKAAAGDAVGHSFAVIVPNDAGRADLLERFVADARAGHSTQVFVSGRLSHFDAPTQISDLTGLRLELESSQDVRNAPARQ